MITLKLSNGKIVIAENDFDREIIDSGDATFASTVESSNPPRAILLGKESREFVLSRMDNDGFREQYAASRLWSYSIGGQNFIVDDSRWPHAKSK